MLLATRTRVLLMAAMTPLLLHLAPATAATCGDGEVAIAGACTPVPAVAAEIRAIIEKEMSALDLRAVIASIRIGDTDILTEAWGQSMPGVPASTDMHFRNGAVAIAYLGTVLLQMAERGELSLDDTLDRWFPELPEAGRVTLRMLINSTSGYPDYVPILPLEDDPFRQWTSQELIDLAFTQPMRCDPGTCFAYSHTNFVILGDVLAKVSGKPVETLISEGVLKPLGLDNTRSAATPIIPAPVLQAYTSERGIYEDSTYWDPSWTLAAGAIMTTDIGDLLTSAIAIGTGALLSPASSADQLARPEPDMPQFSDQFYFGLGVIRIAGWVAQTPSFAGYSAAMAYLPGDEIAIAVTATTNPGSPDAPRPTDVIFASLARYLSPDNVPLMKR